jgi:hypothetical protein
MRRGVTPERYSLMNQDAGGVWQAPSGARVEWFRDSDGNLLSVAQYPEKQIPAFGENDGEC